MTGNFLVFQLKLILIDKDSDLRMKTIYFILHIQEQTVNLPHNL